MFPCERRFISPFGNYVQAKVCCETRESVVFRHEAAVVISIWNEKEGNTLGKCGRCNNVMCVLSYMYVCTGCSLNTVFFLWPLSVSPRCQCVYTMAGQTPGLAAELAEFRKITIF